MKKLLGILVLGLILSSTAIANQLSKSPFIPDDVYNEFNKLPKDHKIKFCGFEYFEPDYYIINKDLAPRIFGYNSRMDNWKTVEGSYRETFLDIILTVLLLRC